MRNKVIDMVMFARENESKKIEVQEFITRFVPSMKELHQLVSELRLSGIEHYKDLTVDTRSPILLGMLKKAYYLKNVEGFNTEERLKYFGINIFKKVIELSEIKTPIKVGTIIECELGVGRISKVFKNDDGEIDYFLTKFECEKLFIMCNAKTLKLSTTENPEWHKVRLVA